MALVVDLTGLPCGTDLGKTNSDLGQSSSRTDLSKASASRRAESPSVERGQTRRDAYCRPATKRDLGHRCQQCRKPFSSLATDLVHELQGGPSQRFHAECWRERSGCDPPGVFARATSSSLSGASSAASLVTEELVSAYAAEWRRASLASPKTNRPRSAVRSARSTTSVLEGLISVEDSHGDRKVACGFTQAETDKAILLWTCSHTHLDDECSICFDGRGQPMQQPVRLPCNHTFCAACVTPWLRRCALCPMCRKDLHSCPLTAPEHKRPASPAVRRTPLQSSVAAGARIPRPLSAMVLLRRDWAPRARFPRPLTL